MRIAINTRFLTAKNLEGLGRFSYETSKWIVNNHPEHEYFFIFDRKFDEKYLFSERITPIVIPPQARHPLLWYIWYEWALPYVLKKHKIDLFLSTDGLGSLRSKIPSCTIIHDLAFEHFPDQVSYLTRKYYQYFIPRYLKQSSMLGTVSQASRNDMIEKYGIDKDRIDIVESACSDMFRPQPAATRQAVKTKYTNGNDFFIFVGAINPRKNVIRIVEAYDKFRQKYPADIKLLLIGRKAWMTKDFEDAVQRHAFKNDIIHLQDVANDELVRLLGSAIASLYPSLLEGFGLPILEAQKSHTPVITSNCFSMPEVAGDAALLVDPFDTDDLFQKMGMVYEDENLRNSLIEKGAENWKRYSWERTAELLYRCAMKSIPHP